MPERKPIFYDEQRRRWRRTRRVLELAGGFFTVVLVIFVINVIRNPDLPDILRADTHGTLHAIRGRLKPKSIRPGARAFTEASAFAATGAIRLEGIRTPVPSLILDVTIAAAAIATNTSAFNMWVS